MYFIYYQIFENIKGLVSFIFTLNYTFILYLYKNIDVFDKNIGNFKNIFPLFTTLDRTAHTLLEECVWPLVAFLRLVITLAQLSHRLTNFLQLLKYGFLNMLVVHKVLDSGDPFKDRFPFTLGFFIYLFT